MRKAIVLSLTILLGLAASVPLALAQGTYTQIDVPGAIHTVCYGINRTGHISGYYTDGNGVSHAFLLIGNSFTTFDFPGATVTYAYGLNDKDRVVGYASNGIRSTGFEYDPPSQSFRRINYPGATSTTPTSIDDSGMVAGSFDNGSGFQQGFERVNASYSLIVPPGDVGANVRGISSRSGELVGEDFHSDGSGANFSEYQGTFQQITISGYPSAQVYGINPNGTALVGFYNPTPFTSAGFLYENNTLQELLPSVSAQQTVASGINASGEVVGFIVDASGINHGFLWTPPADAAKK